jgi:hypothetical protein
MASQIAVSITRASDSYGAGYFRRVYLASVDVDEKGEPHIPPQMKPSINSASIYMYSSACRQIRIAEAAGRMLAQEVNSKNMSFEAAKAAFLQVDLKGEDLSKLDRWPVAAYK